MIYEIQEREDGYAVIGRGNDRAADVGLNAREADKRAHELVGEDGYVEWRALNGRFESCQCRNCKRNRR